MKTMSCMSAIDVAGGIDENIDSRCKAHILVYTRNNYRTRDYFFHISDWYTATVRL